jgi:hypothetical protein
MLKRELTKLKPEPTMLKRELTKLKPEPTKLPA